MTRQRGTALGLVIVGAVAWWVVAARGGGSHVSPLAQDAAPSPPSPAALFDYDAQRVRLDPSETPPVRSTRDPFRFPPPAGEEEPTSSRWGGRARAPVTTPESPLEATDSIPFTLIGVATRDAGAAASRVAVLSGRGQLILAVEGERVDQQYIVAAVGEDVVELRHAATGRIVRLALR